MTVSFKSVGLQTTDRQFIPLENETPIGIKTPVELGSSADGIFKMHISLTDQIQDNLRNLLLTNRGERLAFYDFGASLKELSLELAAEDFENEAMSRIKRTVTKYMPYVDLQSFEYTIDRNQNESTGKVKMRIVYAVPTIGVQQKGLELMFYVGG